MAQQSAAKASRAIGAMFFAAFGGAWMVLWSLEAHGVNWPIIAVVSIISLALFLIAWRQFQQNKTAHAAEADSPESRKAARIFNIVNAVQWILVFVVATLLSNLGYKEWIIPAIILIVGLHFIPLAVGFKVPRHYLTGAALILLAVTYPFTASAGPASPVGCLGAGIILWLSASAALWRQPNSAKATG
jgi:hypothetical protein